MSRRSRAPREPRPSCAPRTLSPLPRGRVFANVLEAVGATPLVRLPRLSAQLGLRAELCLKLEFLNPLASVKDRTALAMVEAAEREGRIAPGRTVIVEASSGNTGLALALVAAAKGYRLAVTMPEGAAAERRRMLRLLGAEVELTSAARGMPGAIERAERIAAALPDAWMARQFDNPANPDAHAATTAEEIWADTAGRVDAVVGGVGTGGTLSGIARALKPRRPSLRVIGVEPAESAVLSGEEPGPHGIQGIGAGFRPAVLDLAALDGIVPVSERDAIAAARLCARTEGVPIGLSSGAVLHAALALARDPSAEGRLIVGIAASSAERYLSTALFAGL